MRTLIKESRTCYLYYPIQYCLEGRDYINVDIYTQPAMSDEKKTVEISVEKTEQNNTTDVENTQVEPNTDKSEKSDEVNDDKKRPLEEDHLRKKKKHRRRQYDDLPKEEPESEEGEKDEPEDENDEEDEEEDLLEIDESNIITSGRRTRGKVIDFKKAAEEIEIAEDDEDDGEFEAREEKE